MFDLKDEGLVWPRIWEGELEGRILVEQGGRQGGQSHICCSGCFMGNRREESDTLHFETLHCWGSQTEYVGLQHWQTWKMNI